MNIYYTAEGEVVVEVAGMALVLTREEAETLFVELGYTLQDMDTAKYDENGETSPQP